MPKKTHLTPEVLVPRLGDYLVSRKLITKEQLEKALAYQKEKLVQGEPCLLGQALVDLGHITREELDEAVTEQIIQLRQALQDANRYLEKRVQERTAELQEALRKLSELNQLKANFISNVSHELRTPLTHIKGYLELMADEALGPLTDEQRHALITSLRSAMRLEELINDLILFSMSAKGALQLDITSFDLGEVLSLILPQVEYKAERKSVKFVSQIDKELPIVKGDQEKIAWAINQLLDNAIKFTDAGGQVTLRVRLDAPHMILIEIEDTGIGIPAERIDEIFEPFHQLDGSSTRRYGGTGLGLTLVKEIVEAHGSLLEVKSVLGRGSSFRFYLLVQNDSEGVAL